MTRMAASSLPRAVAALLAALALVAPGCSDGGSGDGATEDATAEEVLLRAAEATAAVETAAFTLEQSGAGVAIDEAGQLLFLAADGRVAVPGSADAVVTVDALGFVTEVGAVAVDGTVWFTNPLTGDWTEAPPSFSFDPAALFDPDTGLAALLSEAAPTAEIVDPSEPTLTGGLDGGPEWSAGPEGDGPWHRVRASVTAERVAALTGGLLVEATIADAWIDRGTDRLAELRFETPIEGAPSQWRMTIDDYDAEVDIRPPELAEQGG